GERHGATRRCEGGRPARRLTAMRVRLGLGLATLTSLLGMGGVVASGWLGGVGCGGSSDDNGGRDVDSGGDGGDHGTGKPSGGNKIAEGVEECDDGNDKNGDGCENDCTFTCKPGDPLRGDTKCDDKNSCDGAEKCLADHTCSKGTTAPDGTACGAGKVCKA